MNFIAINLIMYGNRSCDMNCMYCQAEPEKEAKKYSGFKFDKEKILAAINNYPNAAREIQKAKSENRHPNLSFQIWGGNPLFHWEDFKTCAEFVFNEFPMSPLSVSDNGLSFKKDEIVEYLISHGIEVQLSHDGVGQWIRSGSFDPLYDESTKSNILKLVNAGCLHSINCMLHNKNYSFIDNIKYFNKWRYSNNIETKQLNIKLNPFIDSDYIIPKKPELGNLKFHGKNLDEHIHELRMIALLYGNFNKDNVPEYHKPYYSFIMDKCFAPVIISPMNMAENGCVLFQRGKLPYSHNIDTIGNFCQCDLIDGDQTVENVGAKKPEYCLNCKYKRMRECCSCGGKNYPKECEYRYKMCQLQEELYYIKNGSYLISEPFDLSEYQY